VLHIDSPGGSVYGVQELSQTIYGSRGSKPIVGIVNCLAASAAYWIGCQADRLVCTPSGDVGSIGVFSMHEDWSKAMEQEGVKVSFAAAGRFKVEGNPYEPLDDQAKQSMQARVDGYYATFVQDVGRGRRKGTEAVRDTFGQGRLVRAPDALKSGMVDQVSPFDQTLQQVVSSMGRQYSGKTDTRATAELCEAMKLPTVAPPSHFSSVDPDVLRRRLRLKIHSDN
jgi:signal peptide peptidase SppA